MKKKILLLLVLVLFVFGPKLEKATAAILGGDVPEDGFITISERFYYDDKIGEEIQEVIKFQPSEKSTFTVDGKTYIVEP